MNPLEVDKV